MMKGGRRQLLQRATAVAVAVDGAELLERQLHAPVGQRDGRQLLRRVVVAAAVVAVVGVVVVG